MSASHPKITTGAARIEDDPREALARGYGLSGPSQA
jgi:hypothetical protein